MVWGLCTSLIRWHLHLFLWCLQWGCLGRQIWLFERLLVVHGKVGYFDSDVNGCGVGEEIVPDGLGCRIELRY